MPSMPIRFPHEPPPSRLSPGDKRNVFQDTAWEWKMGVYLVYVHGNDDGDYEDAARWR